jgi:hypothetical protein
MQDFAVRQNIQRFENLLRRETDPRRGKVLMELLEIEKVKLAALKAAG